MRQRISEALRRAVIAQANHLCEYCLVHEEDFYLSGEVDHISARKHGGINELSNLAYSCIHCNRNKGTDEAIVVEYRIQERVAYIAKRTYPHPNARRLFMRT